MSSQSPHWDETFVYFKHEDEGKGPEFALAFVDALGAGGSGSPPVGSQDDSPP